MDYKKQQQALWLDRKFVLYVFTYFQKLGEGTEF